MNQIQGKRHEAVEAKRPTRAEVAIAESTLEAAASLEADRARLIGAEILALIADGHAVTHYEGDPKNPGVAIIWSRNTALARVGYRWSLDFMTPIEVRERLVPRAGDR